MIYNNLSHSFIFSDKPTCKVRHVISTICLLFMRSVKSGFMDCWDEIREKKEGGEVKDNRGEKWKRIENKKLFSFLLFE